MEIVIEKLIGMKTVKEKLIEILKGLYLNCTLSEKCKKCEYNEDDSSYVDCCEHMIADALIQNGVTIATDTNVLDKNALIRWLQGEKYTNIDENDTEMTEEFESQHQWELSRNCFINKVIKHLESATDTNVGDKWVSVDEPPKGVQ